MARDTPSGSTPVRAAPTFSSVSSSNPVTAVLMDAAPLRRAAYLERNMDASRACPLGSP